jgi:hypothetical protein
VARVKTQGKGGISGVTCPPLYPGEPSQGQPPATPADENLKQMRNFIGDFYGDFPGNFPGNCADSPPIHV